MLRLVLLIVTLQFTIGFSQNNQLESAKNAVDTLFFSNQAKGLSISEEMIPLAIAENDTFFSTYFLDQAGELNRMQGNYDRALEQLHKCLKFKVNWEDLKDLSLTHNNLGKTYAQKGLYDLAIYHFFEALKLMEVDANLIGQAFYLNNIAATYDLQHQYKKAIEFYEKSLTIKAELGDEKGMATGYTNLGISYFNLGDYETAVKNHEDAFKVYKSLKDTIRMVRANNNLSRTLIEMNAFDQAYEKLSWSIQQDELLDDQKLRMDIYSNMALVQLKLEKTDSAEFYLERTEEMALESKSYVVLKTVYQLKSDLLQTKGKFKEALENIHLSIQFNDSLINEENIYAVADIQGKYEYEKNKRIISESQLELIENQTTIERQKFKVTLWIGISIALILTVLVFLLLYYNKQRNNKLLEGQMALISIRNKKLDELNHEIKLQLDKTKISLVEKEELLNNVFQKAKTKTLPPELLSLSKREMEVLSHLALGWTDDQLAEKLFVSKSTIKTHLRRIYSKLLVRGRTEAVNIAHKYDLIGEVLVEKN